MWVFTIGLLQLQHCAQSGVGIHAPSTQLATKLFLSTNVLWQLGQPGSDDGTGESCKNILQCGAVAIREAFGAAFVPPECFQHC